MVVSVNSQILRRKSDSPTLTTRYQDLKQGDLLHASGKKHHCLVFSQLSDASTPSIISDGSKLQG